jgi:hypothetical protein
MVQPSWNTAVVAAVVAVTAVQALALRRATGDAVPFAAVLIVVLNIVGVCGYLYFPGIEDQAATSVKLYADRDAYDAAALVFATASLSTWVGALALARRTGARPLEFPRMPDCRSGALTAAAVIPLAMTVVGRGANALVNRSWYLAFTGPACFVKVGALLLPLGLTAAAILVLGGAHRGYRPLGCLLVGAYFVVWFSTGSRSIALAPPMLLLAALVSGRRTTPRVLVSCVLCSAFLFQLPLALRGSHAGAGLAPWARQLIVQPQSAVLQHPVAAVGNLLFSVPLTGVVATQAEVPTSALGTSVSPMPGFMTDWPTLKRRLAINGFTPYSGLGEVAAVGYGWLVGFFLLVGALVTLAQRGVRSLAAHRAVAGFVLGTGLTLSFAVDMLEYSTRTSTRMLWALAGLVVLLRVWPRPTVQPAPTREDA